MQYGKDNEVNALREYSQIKTTLVGLSGLWINEKFPHLAASPDGLIFNDGKLDGILEVKCLKILRLHSVTDLINKEYPAGELNRQCLKVSGNNLIMKKSHMYYYQIQLQLLIT